MRFSHVMGSLLYELRTNFRLGGPIGDSIYIYCVCVCVFVCAVCLLRDILQN